MSAVLGTLPRPITKEGISLVVLRSVPTTSFPAGSGFDEKSIVAVTAEAEAMEAQLTTPANVLVPITPVPEVHLPCPLIDTKAFILNWLLTVTLIRV